MKAIVCDCCGKVILLPDETCTYGETGIHRLISNTLSHSQLDLCDLCADNLMKAVRNIKKCEA